MSARTSAAASVDCGQSHGAPDRARSHAPSVRDATASAAYLATPRPTHSSARVGDEHDSADGAVSARARVCASTCGMREKQKAVPHYPSWCACGCGCWCGTGWSRRSGLSAGRWDGQKAVSEDRQPSWIMTAKRRTEACARGIDAGMRCSDWRRRCTCSVDDARPIETQDAAEPLERVLGSSFRFWCFSSPPARRPTAPWR